MTSVAVEPTSTAGPAGTADATCSSSSNRPPLGGEAPPGSLHSAWRSRQPRRLRGAAVPRARTRIAAMEPATTITQAFVRTAAERPDAVAYRTRGDEISITWAEARARVADLAGRLAQLGLGRGDTVALMLAN